MTVTMPDPTKSERHLLAAIHHWARTNGWRAGYYGWESPDRTVSIEPRSWDRQVAVRRRRSAEAWWPPLPFLIDADSVTLAVDLLVAHGFLPPFFSSAYGLAEDKYREQVETLEGRVAELEAMLAAANGDAGRVAFATAMDYLR